MKQVTLLFTLLLTALFASTQNIDTAQAEQTMIGLPEAFIFTFKKS